MLGHRTVPGRAGRDSQAFFEQFSGVLFKALWCSSTHGDTGVILRRRPVLELSTSASHGCPPPRAQLPYRANRSGTECQPQLTPTAGAPAIGALRLSPAFRSFGIGAISRLESRKSAEVPMRRGLLSGAIDGDNGGERLVDRRRRWICRGQVPAIDAVTYVKLGGGRRSWKLAELSP